MDGYGKRILVVDEDVGRRSLLEAQLEQEGYAVHTACDGVAGADEMRKRHFEVVIADGHMSGFTDHEFAEFCKTAWPDTPVIFLTRDLSCATDNEGEVDAAKRLSMLRTSTQPVLSEQAPSIWPR